MNEDNQLLLFAYVVYWLTLAGLTMKSRNRKQTLTVNLAIHVAYSIYFFYGMAYKSQYGAGLAWWFYLLVILSVHWLINLVLLLRMFFLARRV